MDSNNTPRAHIKSTEDIKKREREKKRLGIHFLDSKKWNLDIYFQMVFDIKKCFTRGRIERRQGGKKKHQI